MSNAKYCECEHSVHHRDLVPDSDWHEYGRGNLATIKISPSYTVCTACEATLGIDENHPYLEITNVGPYAGQTWHIA
jgi:hypothetical protein